MMLHARMEQYGSEATVRHNGFDFDNRLAVRREAPAAGKGLLQLSVFPK